MEEETLECKYCGYACDPGYDTCYACFSEGNCGACSDPDCPCSCACGMCEPKYYDEPDVDELQENQDFAHDDDYGLDSE